MCRGVMHMDRVHILSQMAGGKALSSLQSHAEAAGLTTKN